MTILCWILLEQFVTDRLYHCTDETGFNYLMPGSWVHGDVEPVPEVIAGPSPGGRDTMKEGWSVAGLWVLWAAGVLVSVSTSVLFSRGGTERAAGIRD